MWGAKSTTPLLVGDMNRIKVHFWSVVKSWTDSKAKNISLFHDRNFVLQSARMPVRWKFSTNQSQNSRPAENTKLFFWLVEVDGRKFPLHCHSGRLSYESTIVRTTYVGFGSKTGQKVDHTYEIWILFDCMTGYAMATDLGAVHIWRHDFLLIFLTHPFPTSSIFYIYHTRDIITCSWL